MCKIASCNTPSPEHTTHARSPLTHQCEYGATEAPRWQTACFRFPLIKFVANFALHEEFWLCHAWPPQAVPRHHGRARPLPLLTWILRSDDTLPSRAAHSVVEAQRYCLGAGGVMLLSCALSTCSVDTCQLDDATSASSRCLDPNQIQCIYRDF